jgi:hypothetical protein
MDGECVMSKTIDTLLAELCPQWRINEMMPMERIKEAFVLAALVPGLLRQLDIMVEHYTQLAGCGDCGNWNPEEEDKVIAARAESVRAAEVMKVVEGE